MVLCSVHDKERSSNWMECTESGDWVCKAGSECKDHKTDLASTVEEEVKEKIKWEGARFVFEGGSNTPKAGEVMPSPSFYLEEFDKKQEEVC